MPAKKVLVPCLVIVAVAALLLGQSKETPSSGGNMTQAAQKFLSSLTEPQRKQATFGYDDAERLNWHFIPRSRKGLPLKDLDGDSLKAAHGLIASGLSQPGYEQTLN